MGAVISLAGARDARTSLWDAYVTAKSRADATGRLTDMKTAVEAYEAWLAAMIPDERARREVWP
jgi:hypothetical protein